MQRFMRRPKRLLLGLALALSLASAGVASAGVASAGVARADSQVYQNMLRSTGLVEVRLPGPCDILIKRTNP
jgi:hypothetical protein